MFKSMENENIDLKLEEDTQNPISQKVKQGADTKNNTDLESFKSSRIKINERFFYSTYKVYFKKNCLLLYTFL